MDETSDEVIWEPLPDMKRTARSTMWTRRLTKVMTEKEPGEWARIYEGALATARAYTSSLRKRTIAIPEPDHDWEFASRKMTNDDGEIVGRIWARYNGPKASQE